MERGTRKGNNVQLPVGTVTFFFTDIEGSTRLLQSVGDDRFAELLGQHSRLVRSAIAAHGGAELKTEGDSFFAVFVSAPEAASAALEAQRALQTNAWPDGVDLRVRMGLHTGNGRLGGDNYIGLDVHRAARIADAGHGGQILLSADTADLLGGEEMNIIRLGEYRLKDVGAETLCQLSAPGLLADFPLPRSLGQSGSRVPGQMTTFIGRDKEINEVSESLAQNRLVTLTGPGGTGKTRLAMTVADSRADGYRDGAFFVSLSGISDTDLLAITILKAFGLQTSSAGILPIDHLVSYLAEKEMLVVLDNFEQLVDSAHVVARVLATSRNVTVLVTSRVPLRIGGEVEVMVLPLPTGGTDDGGLSESGLLFVDRVRSARPDFEPSDEDLVAITQLTERLDGLPLAIELAASRIKVLTPQQMLERLDNKLLAIRGGDLPSRQRTITGTISWSYDLLTESAQQLFVRMAVFVGGATLEEIEAVCHNDESEFAVFDDLGELVDHSLVRELGGEGPTRFTMLHVIREFAYLALIEKSEEDEFRGRHTRVYTELVDSAHTELLTSARLKWMDRLTAEHDNIRAAMDWAVSDEDAASAMTLVAGMWRYWQSRGPLPEAMERVEQALSVEGDAPPALRANALEAAGGIAYWRGDFEAMSEPYGEAVAIHREHGSSSDLALGLYNLSFACVGVGDNEGAYAALNESMELAVEAEDVLGIARANWGFYNVSWYGGHTDEAIRYAHLSVEGFEAVDAPFDLGWAYFALGDSLLRSRDLEGSREAYDKGLPSLLETSDLPGLILYLSSFAALEVLCDNHDRATRLAGATQSMREKTGMSLYDTSFWSEPLKDIRELVGSIDDETIAEFQEGRLMSPEEAVHYALEQQGS